MKTVLKYGRCMHLFERERRRREEEGGEEEEGKVTVT